MKSHLVTVNRVLLLWLGVAFKKLTVTDSVPLGVVPTVCTRPVADTVPDVTPPTTE
jgi:hypothetical protein